MQEIKYKSNLNENYYFLDFVKNSLGDCKKLRMSKRLNFFFFNTLFCNQ